MAVAERVSRGCDRFRLTCVTRVVLQRYRLAAGPAAGHRRGVHHVLAGHVLPVGVAVPSAAPGHPPSQEPEAEDQG